MQQRIVPIIAKHPTKGPSHTPTSNIIFNLSQMGISIRDACFIEIDTYFELLDLYDSSMNGENNGPKMATQADIDNFLL